MSVHWTQTVTANAQTDLLTDTPDYVHSQPCEWWMMQQWVPDENVSCRRDVWATNTSPVTARCFQHHSTVPSDGLRNAGSLEAPRCSAAAVITCPVTCITTHSINHRIIINHISTSICLMILAFYKSVFNCFIHKFYQSAVTMTSSCPQ